MSTGTKCGRSITSSGPNMLEWRKQDVLLDQMNDSLCECYIWIDFLEALLWFVGRMGNFCLNMYHSSADTCVALCENIFQIAMTSQSCYSMPSYWRCYLGIQLSRYKLSVIASTSSFCLDARPQPFVDWFRNNCYSLSVVYVWKLPSRVSSCSVCVRQQ